MFEDRRNFRRKDNQSSVTNKPVNVKAILEGLGIEIKGQSDTHYQVFCIFHSNFNTTAATVSKTTGVWYCWAADCGKKSSLINLVKELRKCDTFAAMRYIAKYETEFKVSDIREVVAGADELPQFDKKLLEKLQFQYWESAEAQEYILSRGIDEFSARTFGLGYDKKKGMVVTPMFDTHDNCVGLIGRSIHEKRFKNSKDLPSSKTLFNISKAKKQNSDTLVIVESNFDCIRAHQAGFPNTVATLMGTFTEHHRTQVSRSFSNVIIAVDTDEPGIALAKKIARMCNEVGVFTRRMAFSDYEMLPREGKDLSDCTDDEIRIALRNAKTHTG